ncbi:MAG TPA: TetM/TetW/TetO/TetS family tetracycline resistance ribosomal protection protein [Candidatus Merdenecus merdavium]|nr:TetM/TetW/TetO/TetS family tetracycline resistance ribosomal protection protein [Candidatus Merdenecus merdavium]
MDAAGKKTTKKHVCVGLLAHVDAGKTTLAESILYLRGAIRTIGRVDHKNAFLDTDQLEKLRGITIFAKQAQFTLGDLTVTLLDTPGHMDFSSEMERALQVMDYAILVINSMDGIQGNVTTLWSLLKQYGVPVFIFVNKMDQEGKGKVKLLKEIQKQLSDGCIDFSQINSKEFYEQLALSDEKIMEKYLNTGMIDTEDIRKLIGKRVVFPCYFGSSLKIDGVEELLDGMEKYISLPVYPDEFGGKVYKISRESSGLRLTHLKVTGGELKVKMPLSSNHNGERWEEKVNEIRIYSGGQFESVPEVTAGAICAVTGLTKTFAGEGLGIEERYDKPILEPVLTYSLELPDHCDVHHMYRNLLELEEEDPQLHVVWQKEMNEIQVQVMGEIQIEILKSLIMDRFQTEVEFGAGEIVYKETIKEAVIGVGHFEPLKHYAEVHLLIEPGALGSGLVFQTDCSEDVLDRNWQRLVLTHLKEKPHKGVLVGAEITDLKITLLAGRAHQKHTEGGDFRQATYRAVRNGLRKAKSVLLEPVYEFTLEVPLDKVGRSLSDIQKMHGNFNPPVVEGDTAMIKGTAPVETMRGYQREVVSYTSGLGRFYVSLKGYEPCYHAEEVIASKAYDPEQDLDNPTGSIFCSHGAKFTVPWDKVELHMHLDSISYLENHQPKDEPALEAKSDLHKAIKTYYENSYTDKELEDIFIQTYGPIKRKDIGRKVSGKMIRAEKPYVSKPQIRKEEFLLVDGYNIIFAWDDLKELAKENLDGARDQLCEVLCNYQGYKKNTLIVVFDAYKVDHYKSEIQKYKNIYIVYTKKAETADQYIEKTVNKIGRKHHVTVATSDALEQMIIWGLGAMRLSADGLKREVERTSNEIQKQYLQQKTKLSNPLLKKEEIDHKIE